MTGTPPPKPGVKPKAAQDRDARLKAALKANLGRRKAQAKARGATEKTKGQTDG